MSVMSGMSQDRRGATAVEFALVLPLLLAMIIAVIEGNRLLWTKQALQEAAAQSARCMAIGREGCHTPAGAALFAQERAASMGVQLKPEAVTVASGQSCNGIDDMNRVALDSPFNSPFSGLVPLIPKRLKTEACFPRVK
jgi:Flp pilus assembly protein TadG